MAKAWEKWHDVDALFINPERATMLKRRCPTCSKPAVSVQIRAERPPYLFQCRKRHQWFLADNKAIPYTETNDGE